MGSAEMNLGKVLDYCLGPICIFFNLTMHVATVYYGAHIAGKWCLGNSTALLA